MLSEKLKLIQLRALKIERITHSQKKKKNKKKKKKKRNRR